MLFIISLLFATALSSSPVELFTESAAFLATMENADPDVVNKMIGLIDELRVDGQEAEKKAVDDADASKQVYDSAKDHHDIKTTELNAAKTALTNAVATLNALTVKEEQERAILVAATKELKAARANAKKRQAFLNKVSARVANEQKAFDQVLQLLDEIIVPKNLLTLQRNLLAFDLDSADPDAVEAVKKQVRALKVAAAKEVTDATAVNDAAKQRLSAAQANHDAADKAHTLTSGQLTNAKVVAEKAEKKHDNAVTAEDLARTAEDSAKVQFELDDAFRVKEIARVAHEDKSLVEARKLLTTLL